MLDKLKAIWAKISELSGAILTGIALLIAGYIYYLRGKVTTLQDKAAQNALDDRTKQILKEMEDAKKQSAQSELDYETLRKHYLDQYRGNGDGNDNKS